MSRREGNQALPNNGSGELCHCRLRIAVPMPLEPNLCSEQHCPTPDSRHQSSGVTTKCGVVHSCLWILEIAMVPQVDEIAAELQLQPLGKRDCFGQAEVPVGQCGTPEGVASEVSATGHRIRQRQTAGSEGANYDSSPVDRS
jgi:hypothetical protein